MSGKLLPIVALGAALAGVAEAASREVGYRTHAALSSDLQALAAAHRRACELSTIGTSREGRAIWALQLAAGGDVEPAKRPALLIVAGLDGDHLVGGAVAVDVAKRLLELAAEGDEQAADALRRNTVYVVPRVNPDAAERSLGEVKMAWRRNLRPVDQDRDGAVDEDPPNDLDGDGLITMMRVFDPDEADLAADPDEPRLHVEPDRDEGQRAEFALYVEGIDDDGDGELNEDPVGGVDLEMNFMHGYQEHADGAGPHQVSEPESRALLEFVLGHQNVAAVLAYGRHDNLSSPPKGGESYPSGAPKTIDKSDAGLYAFIGKRFREITGLQKTPGSAESSGAFFAWAYAQFGVPSFTTPLWTRPEPEQAEGEGPEPQQKAEGQAGEGRKAGGTPSGYGDIAQETIDELRAAAEQRGFTVSDEMMASVTPAQIEQFAAQMGVKVIRVSSGDEGRGGAADADDAAWLRYSDEVREGAGFVPWRPFDHPDLGRVQIGGWVPLFRTNPPADEVPAIAAGQVPFVLELIERFPKVTLARPEVTRLAAGLWEIEVALVNDGYLPTGTAMAVRNRRARPHVVRLDLDGEHILTGRRVNRVWSIPGSGGRESFRWIVRAPDGSAVTITVYSEKYGRFEQRVWLPDEAAPAGGDS